MFNKAQSSHSTSAASVTGGGNGILTFLNPRQVALVMLGAEWIATSLLDFQSLSQISQDKEGIIVH